jgi:hypothetical protein
LRSVKTPKSAGTIAAIALAVFAFFYPASGAWTFVAAEAVFLAWLALRVRKSDREALVAAAREPLEADEAEIVRRYPFYFARPELARECASILAALGLASLVLVPWLTYKLQWPQAIAVGVCFLGVGPLTRLLSPLLALRMAANKGNRDALRLLGAHEGALRKLRA